MSAVGQFLDETKMKNINEVSRNMMNLMIISINMNSTKLKFSSVMIVNLPVLKWIVVF